MGMGSSAVVGSGEQVAMTGSSTTTAEVEVVVVAAAAEAVVSGQTRQRQAASLTAPQMVVAEVGAGARAAVEAKVVAVVVAVKVVAVVGAEAMLGHPPLLKSRLNLPSRVPPQRTQKHLRQRKLLPKQNGRRPTERLPQRRATPTQPRVQRLLRWPRQRKRLKRKRPHRSRRPQRLPNQRSRSARTSPPQRQCRHSQQTPHSNKPREVAAIPIPGRNASRGVVEAKRRRQQLLLPPRQPRPPAKKPQHSSPQRRLPSHNRLPSLSRQQSHLQPSRLRRNRHGNSNLPGHGRF